MKAVFYAWQSELPNRTNRSFIESCLQSAIKQVNLRRPPVDHLFLDQDTRDVSGMPDISEVIFDKIDTCAVFVPDLSLSLRGTSGRASPNANVLIELGYALRAIGDRRIVGVFNDASGLLEELPFDLRRHRWPARYALHVDALPEEKQLIKDALVKVLTDAIAAAAARADSEERGEESSSKVEEPYFEAHGRFRNGEVIAHVDGSVPGANAAGQIVWGSRPQATIELRPKNEISTGTYQALRQRAVQGGFALDAFGPRKAQWYSQNMHGLLAGDVISEPTKPHALCITQLYKQSGMLYGVNQSVIATVSGGRQVLLADSVKAQYEETLRNYLSFYRNNPDYGDTYNLYVTLQYISGLQLREGRVAYGKDLGRIVENFIYHSQESITVDASVTEILRPLFVKLWDSAGAVYHD